MPVSLIRRPHPVMIALLTWLAGQDLTAQEDTVAVMAGEEYEVGPLHRFLMGSGHRALWTRPVRVPVLDPDTFAGGLTVLARGESPQTLSLRFGSPDGREFVFRSVNKVQADGLPRDMQRTVLQWFAQDLVAGKHPGGALVIAPILEAAGVLHASPRLAVLADRPSLGEHRETFAGLLGTIEERPTEVEGEGRFAGYQRIIGSERLLERIQESADDRIDGRAYLTARLVDFLVGDWDRHPDQWRWAEEERDGRRYWLPIPRDRDNAFPDVDGALPRAADLLRSTRRRYEEEYTDLYRLIHNAQPLDMPGLAELHREVWDSIAVELTLRITDRVIADAVRRLPPEWYEAGGEELERKLRARRDGLPAAAGRVYALLATEVDVHGTESRDRLEAERLPDGSLHLRLLASAEDGSERAYFERIFHPTETREVRVWLRGGDDQAAVRGLGGAGGVGLRILGGSGDDDFHDLSGSGSLVAIYDDLGNNTFTTRPWTRVDVRPFREPGPGFPPESNAPPPRDWGTERSKFNLSATWRSELGPILGGGPVATRYGFRRFPYASRYSAAILLAPVSGRAGIEASARRILTGGEGETRLNLRASQLHVANFHGWGNGTPAIPARLRRVYGTEYYLGGRLERRAGETTRLSIGPTAHVVNPEPVRSSPAALPGTLGGRSYGVAGFDIEVEIDGRDATAYPRRGYVLTGTGSGYPLVWGQLTEPFARASAEARAYLPVAAPLETTLALRAGAESVRNPTPFQYAAALGGSTLRGYQDRRFTGEAAIHASGELRTRLTRVNLLLLRGELGALGFVDVGRVFLDAEDSRRWHIGSGVGAWFGSFDRNLVAHLLYARGDRNLLRAGLGVPF